MTDCNQEPMLFSNLGRRRVQGDFTGGTLTSDAGALLLREADRRVGLIDAIDRAIPDPRDPERIHHTQRSMLAQRIISLALGYEDLNDQQALRHDPLLATTTDRPSDPTQPLASPPTLCRLENRVNRAALMKIAGVFVDQFIASFPATPDEPLILDFDATDDPTHGHQEGHFFHGYYDHDCFLPLYVFCGEQLLVSYLRPSNIDGSKHAWAILKLLVDRLRSAWPSVKIVVRGDGGFCRWKMMRWCDRRGVYYLLGLPRNTVLERLALPWTVPAQWHHDQADDKVRLFGIVSYAAKTWDRPRRVIIKAEHDTHGPNPRFVVTNLPGDPHELYDQGYGQRGQMENRIKEQQLGTTTGLVCPPHVLSLDAGQPTAADALVSGLHADGDPATDRPSRHGVSPSPGDHDPREALEDRRKGEGLGATDRVATRHQLSLPEPVPPRRPTPHPTTLHPHPGHRVDPRILAHGHPSIVRGVRGGLRRSDTPT